MKAKAALDLETAAKKANLTVTEEMRQKIEASATGYANARVKVEEVKKALEDAQEAQKFFGDAITESLGDLIIDGQKATDVLKNLVSQLAKAALQAALMGSGPLAGLFGSAGSNGAPGGLIGGLLGGLIPGRATGGPVSAGKPYIVGEKRPELFVPNASGRIVPKVPSGVNGGNTTTLAYRDQRVINITPANGVTPAQMTAALAAYDQKMRRNITSTLQIAAARY